MKSLFAAIIITLSFVAHATESQIYETQEIELKESRQIKHEITSDLDLVDLSENKLKYRLSCTGTFNALQLEKVTAYGKKMLLVNQKISFDQCNSLKDKLLGHIRSRGMGEIFTIKLRLDVTNKKLLSYELSSVLTGKNSAQ